MMKRFIVPLQVVVTVSDQPLLGLIPTVRIELPCVVLIGLMPMQLTHVRALYCHLGHTY